MGQCCIAEPLRSGVETATLELRPSSTTPDERRTQDSLLPFLDLVSRSGRTYESYWLNSVTPVCVSKRRAVEVVPVQAPLRHVVVHQVPKPVIVGAFDEVHQFVRYDVPRGTMLVSSPVRDSTRFGERPCCTTPKGSSSS